MGEVKINEEILNNIFEELKQIREKLDIMDEKELRPEYIEKINKINKQKGINFNSRNELDNYFESL